MPELRESSSGREIYAYTADLWRRAGDGAAALRVLQRMPADRFAGMDSERDSLTASEYFALRAGGDGGLKLHRAPHRLVLDAVRVWSQGGHFERALAVAKARPNLWERAFLLGEIAFYERAFSSQTRVAALFEAETQLALARLDRVARPTDWGEDWPLKIALDLAQLGRNDAAEEFARQTQTRREAISQTATSWVEELRVAGLSPAIWPRLDAARREQLRADTLQNAGEFRAFYRLFLALRFDGDTQGARRVLEVALPRLEAPTEELDSLSAILPALEFWLAARAARELGWDKRAQNLAAQAASIARRGGEKPWKIAEKFFEYGFPTQGAALALSEPPPPGEFTNFYWFAYYDAIARPLKTVPPWIAALGAGLNKVEALAGFVAGQERNRPTELLNDEDEFSLGASDGDSLFIDPDLLNLRWQDVARFPRLTK